MRPVHFEIHASDPQRAIRFYGEVLGWKFTAAGEGYWLVATGPREEPGIDGGLLPRRGPPPAAGQPVNAWVCTVSVPSLDDALSRAERAGGLITVPRQPIAGVGWLAYVSDPEGNALGLLQQDPAAR